MKLAHALASVAFACALGTMAEAACLYPQAPQNIPNGATAAKDDMLAAQATVKEYSQAVQNTYLPCLEQEKNSSIAALTPNDPDYDKKKKTLESIHAKKHNAAMDELQATAARWSEEIAAFKKREAE
jgi:hypothetical protein